MIHRLSFGLVLATVLALAPRPAQGQVLLGPEVAWNDDADLGVGAGIEFDLPNLYPGIAFMGDFLWFFPGESFDYFEFNTNLTYDFPLEETTVVPFALAGLNIGRVSYDDDRILEDGDGNTDVAFNLGGGLKFGLGSFRPRVAARFALGNDNFTLFGFLPFQLAN
ncbi:MAG: hypothetical protein P8188_00970 [Gemmatimonadota bacterium]